MNKGITLITLIITCIVIMILIGATTMVGFDIVEKAEQQETNKQLAAVGNAVLEQYTKYIKTKDTTYLIGTKYKKTDSYIQEIINKVGIELVQIPSNYAEDLTSYYQLSTLQLRQMGIEDSKYTYIVNYLTGEVINQTKALAGEKYYMYSRSYFDGNITDVEEVVGDKIRIAITPTTWTSTNVTVYLSYVGEIPTGYVIQYKKGNETWTTGDKLTVETNNTTVYARLYKSDSNDEMGITSKTITNIDKTAPTAPTNIESTATTNSITVQASGGTDGESGIAGYQYRINGGAWSVTIANGTSHTFSGLTAVTNYTIEARTVDNVGGLSGVYSVTEKTTAIAQIITETSEIYGVTKERTAPIPVGYTASQIAGENTIAGGLVIYQTTTPVTGTANSAEHISAMETYNQYVWIPIDDINDMVMCKKNASGSICNLQLQGEELICTTHGYTTATELTEDNIDTTGLAGRLYGVDATLKETTTEGNKIYQTNMQFAESSKFTQTFAEDTDYREPDIVTDCDKDDVTSGNNYMELVGIADKTVVTFKKQLNSDYIEMAKSVAKYGGFYIARYEAGANGSSKKNQDVLTTSASSGTNYLAGNTWYGLYNILRNKTGVDTNIVKSHMVWRKSV